jgi:hypothetical protein
MYGVGTSTREAFLMGAPVITLIAARERSPLARRALLHAQQLGLDAAVVDIQQHPTMGRIVELRLLDCDLRNGVAVNYTETTSPRLWLTLDTPEGEEWTLVTLPGVADLSSNVTPLHPCDPLPVAA